MPPSHRRGWGARPRDRPHAAKRSVLRPTRGERTSVSAHAGPYPRRNFTRTLSGPHYGVHLFKNTREVSFEAVILYYYILYSIMVFRLSKQRVAHVSQYFTALAHAFIVCFGYQSRTLYSNRV